ncbi:MAG: hypothetical protein CVV64_19290 [Candidatus Wallbacteria bacterium HGW-Wallbacteria-1]|jgi:hypothetical protein|uniref:Uncharacterized protein n=1 Tax=Candidatus Wallbacteria bacterium HGW-Wallbacteria-1 TaxID=2013854 RepID=A0A2N1PJ71_9BACT|nr:MAG: hypothetical protein CVV64_19290 [Candidatus Wallbacteria bacterium HGW-Wallbacteria-1]
MPIGGTPVPKREVIDLVVRYIPGDQIREMLKIQAETDFRRRLDDFSKVKLLEVLQSTEIGRNALEETKANYPLSSSPSLYLVSVSSWPGFPHLLELTTELAAQMQSEAVRFGSDRTVRSVYLITPSREFHIQIPFQEIPLVYEKKIEYVVADPESEDFGETDVIYSLEKAIIWYSSEYKHALLLCGDFQAVKPILYYCRTKLDMSWQLPYLSEEMLVRLAEGANPRTASFTRIDDDPIGNYDAQSLTISDHSLGERRSYRSLSDDPSRQQTFGFYSSHPDLVYGGMGISRQYGRIWTPARLRKDTLLALSINLIQKTELELNREAEVNLNGFIAYYRNVPIKLGRKNLRSQQRYYFEELIKAIIRARRSPTLEFQLEPDFLRNLIEQYQNIDVVPALNIHCENCGDNLARCLICNSPLTPIFTDLQITFHCPIHPDEQQYQDNQLFPCDCGANIELTFSANIRILPGVQLLKAIHKFLAVLENQQYDGSFIITGNVLRLLPRNRVAINEYHLSEFRMWQTRGHIHQRNISDERKIQYRQILGRIKEKCIRNNRHSSLEICAACMQEAVTTARIHSGNDLCLARLFGYAIDEEFDGVHHGHEVADIRYLDVLFNTGEEIRLGIHLKSRESHRVHGLGRSVSCIKGLYTQYCYSAYLATLGGERLDVIGVSVPNEISDEVRENFQFISSQFGFPLIVLDEEDWLNIMDAALEKAAIEQE